MAIYREVDVSVSASGDITLASNNDLAITSGSGVLKQDVAFRLRTDPGDFYPHPETGAGLSDLIGEPNSRETSRTGEAKIIGALVGDGMVANADLYVRGVPLNQETIAYYVFVNNGSVQLNVSPDVIFSMMNGLKNIPGV